MEILWFLVIFAAALVYLIIRLINPFTWIPGPNVAEVFLGLNKIRDSGLIINTVGNWRKKYGNRLLCGGMIAAIFRVKILILTHPDDIKAVLSSKQMVPKGYFYDFFKLLLGSGLITCQGSQWQTKRKFLTPAFHFSVLEKFQAVFNRESHEMAELIRSAVSSGRGEELDMFTRFIKFTLASSCGTFLGVRLPCQRDVDEPFTAAILKENEYLWHWFTTPWLHPNFIASFTNFGRKELRTRKVMYEFVKEVVAKRKEEFRLEYGTPVEGHNNNNDDEAAGKSQKFALLDLLLNEQMQGTGSLMDEAINDEANTFLHGAVSTTASSLFWAFFLLAANPTEQEKVHEELDAVFLEEQERSVTTADLAQLKYLECCLKEGHRLFSVPFISRRVEQDFKLDSKITLPKGTDVIISPWHTHRLEEYFPDPLEFRPERHLAENSAKRHPFSYLPFSAGLRNCIAQKFALAEEKTVMTYILRDYKVVALDTYESMKPVSEITVAPTVRGRFKFIPRRQVPNQ